MRSNAHSYRNWGEGLGNDPSYPAPRPPLFLQNKSAVSPYPPEISNPPEFFTGD